MPAESAVDTPFLARSGRRVRAAVRGRAPLLVYTLALVPPLLMLVTVQQSSQVPWRDYWDILAQVTAPDGGLIPRRTITIVGGHPFTVPSLVYWADLRIFGGAARSLGYLDIALVLGQLLIVRLLLGRLGTVLSPWGVALLTVVTAALLFAPQGAWNFVRSMSGVSWLTANLLVLTTVYLASTGRALRAALPAALASLTYATGLMAWPALLIASAFREGWGRRQWWLAAAGLVVWGCYGLAMQGEPSSPAGSFDVNDAALRVLQVVGSVVSPDPVTAPVVGAVGLATLAAMSFWTVRSVELRDGRGAWVAIGAYATLSAVLIGLGRGGRGDDLGVVSRYASISALLWIAALVLLALWARERGFTRVAVVAAGTVALAAFTTGTATRKEMLSAALQQDVLGVAMRLGAPEGIYFGPGLASADYYRRIGQYPFDARLETTCGPFPRRLDPRRVAALRTSWAGRVDRLDPGPNPRLLTVSGWVDAPGATVRCVIVSDQRGRVIGATALGVGRPDVAASSPSHRPDLGFTGVARSGARRYRAFAILKGDERLYELPGATGPSSAG